MKRSRPLSEADVKYLEARARGQQVQAKPTKPRKYHNQPTEYNGLMLGSGDEARRAAELQWMEQQGLITDLVLDKRKLRYPLIVNGHKIGTYTPDAQYREQGQLIVEDVKSKPTKTREYGRTKKLMWALYGIRIREIMYTA